MNRFPPMYQIVTMWITLIWFSVLVFANHTDRTDTAQILKRKRKLSITLTSVATLLWIWAFYPQLSDLYHLPYAEQTLQFGFIWTSVGLVSSWIASAITWSKTKYLLKHKER